MQDLSLHLLDIIENSAQAEARNIYVTIIINEKCNRLTMKVKDNGKGMDEETIDNAQQPFFTTKTSRKKKIGLGIPLFKQNAEQCDGSFSLKSKPNKGTALKAQFRLDHIDRMPLGNITDTILTSIIGHPTIDYTIEYRLLSKSGSKKFLFKTAEIRKELGDIPLDYPDVVTYIRENLCEGFESIYVKNY